MSDALRILLVEDSEDDAELVTRALGRGGASVAVTRVEDGESLRDALAQGPWDAVIADFALPRFSAPEALEVVQGSGLDLPFIVVSGTIGEDTAVAMMRAGAHDYLMKDKLARLLPALEHEMADAAARRERREAQERLQVSLEQYRGLYEAISGGIVVEDLQGRIVEANDVACAILGRDPDEMDGHRPDDIDWGSIHEDGTPFPRSEHPTAFTLRTGQPTRDVVMGLRHPTAGRITWILVSSEPILDPTTGHVTAAVATFSDITARKEAERALQAAMEQYRGLYNAVAGGIVVEDAQCRIIEVNDLACEMLGWTRERLLGQTERGDDTQPIREDGTVIRTDEHPATVARCTGLPVRNVVLGMPHGQTGQWVWVQVNCEPMRDATGSLTGHVMSTLTDITARKEAEEALRESEERFRVLAENGLLGTYIMQDGCYTYVNPALLSMFGCEAEDLLGTDPLRFVEEQDRAAIADRMRRRMAGEPVPNEYSFRGIRKDGRPLEVEAWGTVTMLDGVITGIGAMVDVTARKEAERALRESELRYRTVADNTYDWELWTDPRGTVLYCSPACEALTGRQPHEFLADPDLLLDIVHPDDADSFRRHYHGRGAHGGPESLAYRIRRPDGTERWVEHVCKPVFDDSGHHLGTRSSNRDITARVQTQQALRDSEERFRAIFDHAAVGITVTGMDCHELECNQAMADMLGMTREEYLAADYDDIFHPEDRNPDSTPWEELLAGKRSSYQRETRMLHQDGHAVWVRFTVSLAHFGPQRDPVAITMVEDITARKAAEERRQESEARFRAIFDQAAVGIVFSAADGPELDCNQAMADMLGRTREEYLGATWDDIVHPEDRDPDPEVWQELLDGKRTSYHREARLQHQDGHTVWARLTVSLAHFGPDQELASIAVVEDITARKEAEQALAQSEERLRLAFEAANEGLWDWRLGVAGSFRSPRFATMLGYEPGYFDGQDDLWRSLIHPDDLPQVERATQAALDHDDAFAIEFRVQSRDQGWRWLLTRARVVARNEAGMALRMVGTNSDITARKEAEEALRESEARYREMFEHMNSGVAVYDVVGNAEDFVFRDWNSRAARMTGLDAGQVLGKSLFDCFPGSDGMGLAAALTRVARSGVGELVPALFYDDGRIVGWWENSVYRLPSGEVVAIFDDVTEQVTAQESLHETTERLQAVVDAAPVAVVMLDGHGTVVLWNPAAERIFGYKVTEVLGRTFPSVAGGDEGLFGAMVRRVMADEGFGDLEVRVPCKDGTEVDVSIAAGPVHDRDGHVVAAMGVLADITRRRQVEAQLAAETERLAVTLRSIADCVIATDTEGLINLMNKAAEALTGWTQEEAIGRFVDEVLTLTDERTGEPCTDVVARVLTERRVLELPAMALVDRDGRQHIIAESAAPIHDTDSAIVGAVLAFRDVSEERTLRTEALKAQKLESLGILAGGIAHDFNNVLLVINGNLQMARLFDQDTGKHNVLLHNAERACMQARDLTQQLLTFAKGGAPVKEVVAIGSLIRDTALFAVSGSKVRCEFDLADEVHTVEVDQGQISQVINNLVINADQAMATGGTIRVSIRNVTLDEGSPVPLPPGEYVRISVADEGIGIPPDLLDRIFDPYFTTKARGSGLGLASCYSIIQQHAGHLGVTSTLGVGSTFSITLPAADLEVAAATAAERAIPTGTGRVLVMDDEASVRELAAILLGDLGYEVETAEDGEEAVGLYKAAIAEGRPFVAVILDLTVRGAMGGREAVEEMRVLDPEVRAIVCSGYSADPVMARYEEYGFRAVVLKPYDVAELAQAVSRVARGE